MIEANGIPKAEYKKREQEINEKIEETRRCVIEIKERMKENCCCFQTKIEKIRT